MVQRVFRQHIKRLRRDAEAVRAEFQLLGGFLAADIQHTLARFAQIRAHLKQQRGFADAGIEPMIISAPSTMPPPNTRSSSLMPVDERTATSSGISRRSMAEAPVPGRCFGAFAGAPVTIGADSTIVFHAPHPGQRPTQRDVSYPHAVQANRVFSFAISDLRKSYVSPL